MMELGGRQRRHAIRIPVVYWRLTSRSHVGKAAQALTTGGASHVCIVAWRSVESCACRAEPASESFIMARGLRTVDDLPSPKPSVPNVVVTTSNSALDRAIEVCKSKSLPTYHKPTTPSNRVQNTAHGQVHTHTHTAPRAALCRPRYCTQIARAGWRGARGMTGPASSPTLPLTLRAGAHT